MVGIDGIAPIQFSNRLQDGVVSEHGSALHPELHWSEAVNLSVDLRTALAREKTRLEFGRRPFLCLVASPRRNDDDRSKSACAHITRAAATPAEHSWSWPIADEPWTGIRSSQRRRIHSAHPRERRA